MIGHYIKIAFRNLLKYKTQSIISILGLAVGFTCFALSSLWIHYELTYDSFHKDSDRIYYVRIESKQHESGVSNATPQPLAAYLEESFPEIEMAVSMGDGWTSQYKYENIGYELRRIGMDIDFFTMFGMEIITGSDEFMITDSKKLAITEDKARELFGKEDPIGKKLENDNEEYTICAVVKNWSGHSNIPFDILGYKTPYTIWYTYPSRTFIKLEKDADIKDFAQKLYEHIIEQEGMEGTVFTLTNLVLTPITEMRYNKPFNPSSFQVAFNHIILFLFVGLLVVFCALFNYMTIFVSRMRMRLREVALRKICGSSAKEVFYLFSIEFILNLMIALILGMVMAEVVLSGFKELSGIHTSRSGIYLETIIYIVIVSFIALLIAQIPLYYFRRQTLQLSINGSFAGSRNNLFRKVSITLQLVISMGLIFCTVVMMKQLYYLSNTDIGMERKGIASFSAYPNIDAEISGNIIAQLPMVTDVLKKHNSLIPKTVSINMGMTDWEDKPVGAEKVSLDVVIGGKEFCDFHGLILLEGRMLQEGDDDKNVLINQQAAREFGWAEPIGKKIGKKEPVKTVVGVIKDFYNQSPITPVRPTSISLKSGFEKYFGFGTYENILFKYHEGSWEECKAQLEQQILKEYPDARLTLTNAEEEYAKYLKSENALLILLSFVSVICAVIAVFGIFSLITLTCEQRRKEIAVRKVNGATMGDILGIFFREYVVILLISSVVAFSVGYYMIKLWLENYVKQTEVSLWIYLIIFTGILIVIIVSVGFRIWKAASQNPAEVIKSE